MSTITTINGSDVISTSRTTINNNFSALNTDKIETSVLDTDTALTANSDSKVATQKAVKAYVDTGGNVNASTTTKGIVEEATSAEVIAGTAAGTTGARLFLNPSLIAETGADKVLKLKSTGLLDAAVLPTSVTDAKKYTVGAQDNALVKTYFNVQLLFILWTGTTAGDATTSFVNWVRNSTDVAVLPGGAMADLSGGTGGDQIYMATSPLWNAQGNALKFDDTNIVILDWWAKLSASGTGDVNMGFMGGSSFDSAYNDSGANKVCFAQSAAGALYATISKTGVGITNTDISSGLTLTNWNNYRIELDLGNNALFYVNGTLKATLSGANLYTSTQDVLPGFGRSNTNSFIVTAPNLALQMNP